MKSKQKVAIKYHFGFLCIDLENLIKQLFVCIKNDKSLLDNITLAKQKAFKLH